MTAISDDAGLHSGEPDLDVHDPRWQRRQVDGVVEFAVLHRALTTSDFTFEGEFFTVDRPTTIATRPLQERLPAWVGGELQVGPAAARPGRPAIAVAGTPDQVTAAPQDVIDATGVRRLLVETFSRAEAELFARVVMPALRERNLA